MPFLTSNTQSIRRDSASRRKLVSGAVLLGCALISLLCGCHQNRQPEFILPEEAAISRATAYSATMPPFPDGGYPPMLNEMHSGPIYPPSSPARLGVDGQPPFAPMPTYFPNDGPQLMPGPNVELAPPPISPDIERMSGVYCCQRCEGLTKELEDMSQRVDELSAMMEAQRLTIESLNAALLRADANINQLHDDLVWHRGELDRLRTDTEEQQERDVERLREIADIVDRLSSAP